MCKIMVPESLLVSAVMHELGNDVEGEGKIQDLGLLGIRNVYRMLKEWSGMRKEEDERNDVKFLRCFGNAERMENIKEYMGGCPVGFTSEDMD